ncbi:MAG: hypothetical protein WBW52_16010 [Desulfobaccales bacterium]
MTDKKERLKPISFYGHKLEDVLRAIMRVDPRKLKEKKIGGAKYFVRESKKENQDDK